MSHVTRVYQYVFVLLSVLFSLFEKISIFLAAARMTQRDMALTVIDANGQRVQCSMPIKITIEADCPSYCRLPATRNGNASVWKRDRKRKSGSKREKKCEAVEKIQVPSWKSEYQDNISKIGHAIIRAKLHHARKKALPLQYQYSSTSN